MHINKLPVLILDRIFYSAIMHHDHNSNFYLRNTWTDKANILSVCRLWRELALPRAYKTSFVQFYSAPVVPYWQGMFIVANSELAGPEDERKASTSSDINKKVYTLQSNLDFFPNTGSRYWPTNFQISISAINDFLREFRLVIDKIREHGALLKNVRKVELFIRCYNNTDDTDDGTGVTSNTADACSMGKEFCKLLPLVKHIKWDMLSSSPDILGFTKTLIKGYAHQLVSFSYPRVALEGVNSFSDTIRQVSIDEYDYAGEYMPQICANNLTALDLTSISRNSIWTTFQSKDGSKCLDFANLKILRLSTMSDSIIYYDEGNSESIISQSFNYKVTAPKLEKVSLDMSMPALSFFAAVQSTSTINHVELHIGFGRLYFTQFDLDAARDLLTKWVSERCKTIAGYSDMYIFMNAIFNIHGLAKKNKAHVFHPCHEFDILNSDWKYLMEIQITPQIHMGSLSKLLLRLPNLESICISNFKLEAAVPKLSRITEKSALKPIDCKLKFIKVGSREICTDKIKDKLRIYVQKLVPNCQVFLNLE